MSESIALPAVDYRSFHVFTESGKYILLDRATGAIAEIEKPLFHFMQGLERGLTYAEAHQSCGEVFEDVEIGQLTSLLEDLQRHGFFHYTPVDHAQQESFIQGLMKHKSRRLQLLMAQSCNLGCRYCYAWRNGSNQKGVLMEWDVAKQSVDFLVKRSGNRRSVQVTFFGGEPLLNYEMIKKVVAYCEEIGPKAKKEFTYELITNATLLDEETVEFVAKHRFLMMISIDGWKEMHNYNRPSMKKGEDEYDTILKNALHANRVFQERGLPEIKVRANLTGKFHDSKAVKEYLHGLGFRKIGVSVIEPLAHADPSPSALTEEQLDAYIAREKENNIKAVERLERNEPLEILELQRLREMCEPLQPRHMKGITCGVNRNTAVVDTSGNIYPCHRYEGMANYIVGNVFTGMDREKTLGYYRKVNGNATSRCHSCWLRDYCAGGCAWLLSAKNGTIVDPTERECDRRRGGMERLLYLRTRLRDARPAWFQQNQNRDLSDWQWEDENKEPSQCGSCNDCGEGCK